MRLMAPDHQIVDTRTGSSNQIVSTCLHQTGWYQVVLWTTGLLEAFEYDLSLLQHPIAPLSSGTNQFLAVYHCQDNRVYVRWSASAANYRLYSAATLAPCVCLERDINTNCIRVASFPDWQPVTNTPYRIADHLYVDEGFPSPGSMKFYRLICTNSVDCGIAPAN